MDKTQSNQRCLDAVQNVIIFPFTSLAQFIAACRILLYEETLGKKPASFFIWDSMCPLSEPVSLSSNSLTHSAIQSSSNTTICTVNNAVFLIELPMTGTKFLQEYYLRFQLPFLSSLRSYADVIPPPILRQLSKEMVNTSSRKRMCILANCFQSSPYSQL